MLTSWSHDVKSENLTQAYTFVFVCSASIENSVIAHFLCTLRKHGGSVRFWEQPYRGKKARSEDEVNSEDPKSEIADD